MIQTAHPLKILIVGAGLGGLAASLVLRSDGHHVTVLEAAPVFVEAGAGIRVPPNFSRLLLRWGVDLETMTKCTSNRYHFVRWKDGSSIVKIPLDNATEVYGAPYYLAHRADLHASLLDAATRAGVIIRNNKRIMSYDFDLPSVSTEDREQFNADLVIIADGIKSSARSLVTGHPDVPRDTGDVAYRILIPGEKLLADPDLAHLITDSCTTTWCGPKAHLVGYPIRGGELYNIVVCITSQTDMADEVSVIKGDNRELCERFSAWEPRVQKLCALTGSFSKWRLCDLPSLQRWIHPSGKAALLGDACHPMLPYLAQGAAQCLEDAAALRQFLSLENNVTTALRRYEAVRRPRTSMIQANARGHQYILHVGDGPEQEIRDQQMAVDDKENPVFWGCHERRQWLFGHDAEIIELKGPG